MATVSSLDLPVRPTSSPIKRTPKSTASPSIPKTETPLRLALLREQLLAGVRHSLPFPTRIALPLVSHSPLLLFQWMSFDHANISEPSNLSIPQQDHFADEVKFHRRRKDSSEPVVHVQNEFVSVSYSIVFIETPSPPFDTHTSP